MNDNISYEINESCVENDSELNTNLEILLKEFEYLNVSQSNDDYSKIQDYDLNYTGKQLLLICEYYGISKGIKTNKLKKQEIIEQIIIFENDFTNFEAVGKRHQMWYYMNELKNDKYMKKYVIWN